MHLLLRPFTRERKKAQKNENAKNENAKERKKRKRKKRKKKRKAYFQERRRIFSRTKTQKNENEDANSRRNDVNLAVASTVV